MANPQGTRRSRGPAVIADEGSLMARWAEWQARPRQTPLTAIERDEGEPTLFISNELLLNAREKDLAEELCGRYRARIVPPVPIPPPPPGLGPSDQFPEPDERPLPIRLRFDEPPQVERPADILGELLYDRYPNRLLTFTSSAGLAVASLAARYAAQGRRISLNDVASPAELPLKNLQEAAGIAAFSPPNRSRITDAWQLVESARPFQSLPVVWIGILDGGFWLDGKGAPMGLDFPNPVLQVNLHEPHKAAGGTNMVKCNDKECPWHGNAVATLAAAAVNLVGSAGAGGTVALPAMFKSDLSLNEIYTCLRYCVAWGIHILNMSFSKEPWEFDLDLFFDLSDWDEEFQDAQRDSDGRLIIVASAGNQGTDLSKLRIRPATRTPGVITVGALDGKNARQDSNYGDDSVNIWAPGTDIPVGPDGNNPTGSLQSGTSMAAPIVSGVVAMMRAVNPSLKYDDVRQILWDTGWDGTDGRVKKGLDAHAAVLRALGNKLPADLGEPNNTASTAQSLLKGPSGTLTTWNGIAARSVDADWWKFDLSAYSEVIITLEWYDRIANMVLHLEADDADNDGPDNMIRTAPADGNMKLQGLLSPGTYRIRLTGQNHTAYQLNVRTSKGVVPPDNFEPNDTFDTATRMAFEADDLGFAIAGYKWGPGTFRATLHQESGPFTDITGKAPINSDYYEFNVPAVTAKTTPTITIKADMPLDLTLYDAARNVIGTWTNVKIQPIKPPEKALCYLRVSGKTTNRYWIMVYQADPTKVPKPHKEAFKFPDWWDDSPLFMFDKEQLYSVAIGQDRGKGDSIVFQRPQEAIQVQLLDATGASIRESSVASNGKVVLSTVGLDPGAYFLRVARKDGAQRARPLQLRLAPPL